METTIAFPVEFCVGMMIAIMFEDHYWLSRASFQ